ncbi:N-fatty-acyl-amino acid synthase/hydrolase PM20D1-like [Scyliorhinus canicula]|uniref:N-fatty-acyl-amino acid synthase/hydrolase PM20D1-like n=1 Tax=Scyliorhinus canicula TaxID=7830 RepID=UPI0018F34E78|nr:N-fatty-acyl-amino acid synthase/hydrolase PM20D1-like [Scyliorhinus canicula]
MKNIKGKVKVAAIIVLLLVSVFLIFLSALLIRTYTFTPAGSPEPGSHRSMGTALAANFTLQERHQLLANLKGALRIATVTRSPTDLSPAALAQLGNYLPTVFPTVFSSDLVQHEVIANYSHLFTVRGSNDSLQPYMLIAHLDVVPALAEEWEVPPFSAEERNGYLYGRGTLDDKSSVMGILQGLEFLLKRGYKPCRAFYIGFGHDEEVGGNNGARNIARVLQSRGTKLSFLLDEGSAIFDGIIPGLDKPAALIATSEKGYVSIGLNVSTGTGHSSMPPKETSIGILAAAVSKLENNPMPRMFGQGPESGMFEHLSSQLRFPLNVVMANLWLFSSLVGRITRFASTRANVAASLSAKFTIYSWAGMSHSNPPQDRKFGSQRSFVRFVKFADSPAPHDDSCHRWDQRISALILAAQWQECFGQSSPNLQDRNRASNLGNIKKRGTMTLDIIGMWMLGRMCGMMRRTKIRKQHIRGSVKIVGASKEVAEERLKWPGHMEKEGGNVVRSVQSNVIAPFARATVNFRLHPAHTQEELLRQVKNIISDERVKIDVLENNPSLPLSSYDGNSFGYQVIKGTIGNIFPEVAIAPGLCVASTDTKHYQNLTKELYRFSPMILKKEDLSRIHGVNERISVKNYEEFVKFYFQLMQHSDLWSPTLSHCTSGDL